MMAERDISAVEDGRKVIGESGRLASLEMWQENEVQHVFLVGAKSLGAYGGYETFVYKLTEYHQDNE